MTHSLLKVEADKEEDAHQVLGPQATYYRKWGQTATLSVTERGTERKREREEKEKRGEKGREERSQIETEKREVMKERTSLQRSRPFPMEQNI